MMINLTELGRKVVGISECSEYSECSDFQSSHRFNKIQQKIICDNLCKFVAEKTAKSTKSVFAPNN